jgi:KaiC/GvpD/RAD55 family RecA-like ATPase
MEKIIIRKAERRKAKLRLAIAGPSGSGKTYSALRMARGVAGPTGRICMIDTERGSGDLYAHLTDYDIITLTPPFKPERYQEAIHAAEDSGYDVIVIDSLSHAWSDEGGILDQADKMEASGRNRFTLWADLTPQYRKLVNALLNSPAHIIATVRSKQDYTLERDEKTGRSSVKKVGMAPVMRDGLEYEFTVFLDLDQNHNARASKDRTSMFDNEIFTIDERTGERLLAWLNEGSDNPEEIEKQTKKRIVRKLKQLDPDMPETKEAILEAISYWTGLDSNKINAIEAALDAQIKNPTKKKPGEAELNAAKTDDVPTIQYPEFEEDITSNAI